MIRPLLLAALVAAPSLAQSDPALAPTDAQFRDDLRAITNVVATAALVHDATGAFPATTFGLLGSRPADRTRLRGTPLSDLTVSRNVDGVVIRYVPLPVSPYVRRDRVVEMTVALEDGLYQADYEIVRREDPDDGGDRIAYDRAGRFLVTRGYGTACVDLEVVRARLADRTFRAEPGTLGPEPLTVQVHPVGEAEPVFYRETL